MASATIEATESTSVDPVQRLKAFGVPVDSVTMEEALRSIQDSINQGISRIAVALNVPKLWRIEKDDRLKRIITTADFIFPEQVITQTARLCGTPLRGYIGNDRLTRLFLTIAAEKGYRLFFLGTRPAALRTMVKALRSLHPGINIAGYHDGFFTDSENESVAREIRDSRPDVLFVGMGTPRQEYWMDEYGRHLGVPVVIGVGGTLDVLAGLKSECPDFIRRLGAEWIYRMLEDPRGKIARYCRALPWFLGVVLLGVGKRFLRTGHDRD